MQDKVQGRTITREEQFMKDILKKKKNPMRYLEVQKSQERNKEHNFLNFDVREDKKESIMPLSLSCLSFPFEMHKLGYKYTEAQIHIKC